MTGSAKIGETPHLFSSAPENSPIAEFGGCFAHAPINGMATIEDEALPSMFLRGRLASGTETARPATRLAKRSKTALLASARHKLVFAGTMCLTFFGFALVDQQLQIGSWASLPAEPQQVLASILPSPRDAANLIVNKSSSRSEESWADTLALYKQLLTQQKNACPAKPKLAQKDELFARLEAWAGAKSR